MAIDTFHGEYHWLSNFEPSPIVYKSQLWPTVEHAYQAAKTDNTEQKERIRAAPTPSNAKVWGRKATMRRTWEDEKVGVMCELLERKFSIPEFRDKLLATGDEELIEGNWWGDTFWGVCEGRGLNWLGVILMTIRKGMRE